MCRALSRSNDAPRDERGAAAVEFALVAMLLITLLLGIMEFGYAFLVNGTLAGSAREAAREYAITGDAGAAVDAAVDAGSVVGVTAAMVSIPAGACPAGPPAGATPSVTVTVTYPDVRLTGFFGSFDLTGTGTMRCNG